ncbi:MAG TPA: hypothetical protein PK345_07075 [Bacteroidales bacterium]|jgi:hypothetical protein|nr:hypothetical protein [Bacteroidales bacterium]MBP7875000.1 hypothetical protein [Bacteroidales bacterium]MCZ2282699.1 hypothetical protein [Bacteroidales bacterium]HPX34813.1 hypothetical protein [Bacteroidales bacterium]HQB47994.1 hypothetical protein [Bacteroidales bacterium]
MKFSVKHILLFALIALLTLPVFQHGTKLFNIRPLDGDFILSLRPQYTWKTWMNGTFQSQFNNYLEDHIGFRSFFVRLNNQLDFFLFKKANAEGIVVGKNNMLFEYDYIRALNGRDFIGKSTIDKKLLRLKFLQKHFKENFDIDFLLILEPSKARTYPEYLPKHYQEMKKTMSNYEYIGSRLNDLEIKHLDLNRLFINAKDTASYPVYPLYGTHWSEFTMSFVADTLIQFFETMRNINMPGYKIEMVISDTLHPMDYDGGRTLNILLKLPHQPMAYPVFTFDDNGNDKIRPMVLAVADSYYWNFFNTRIPLHLFANEAFWYFNAKVYPDFYYSEKWTKDLNLQNEVEKQNIIILSITERFLYNMGWNFIDQLYDIYTPEYTGNLVYNYENAIRLNADWFNNVLQKAEKEKMSLEKAIYKEAYYQAFVNEPETFLTWYGDDHFRSVISNDKNWSSAVRTKASEAGITFEEQLTKDAEWVFEKEYPEIFKLNKLIANYKTQITKDSLWFAAVSEKAQKYFMPVEEMLNLDAEYIARQEASKSFDKEERVQVYIQSIKEDPEWLEVVIKKAAEQGKSIEEMIREDAIFMVDQELKK